MPTYSGNCYEILSQVRYGINEFSLAYVQGTDVNGAFKNEELIRQINNAQNYLWAVLFEAFPEYFLKPADIAFTNSVAVLPADCFKIKELTGSFAGEGAEDDITESTYTVDDEGNFVIS